MWVPIRMERVRCGGRGWNKCFNFFFPPVSAVGQRKWATPCCQTTLAPRDAETLFDDALDIPTCGRVFQGCCLTGFDSSEMLTASLQNG